MKIKINWGTGITIGMGTFMLFIIVMAVQMFRQSSDDYDHQYYEKGLAFDSVYNQEKQVVTDRVQPILRIEHEMLYIDFTAPAEGNVDFERLADERLNRSVPFKADADNKISIPLGEFRKGRWDLRFEWKNNGKKYQYRKQIIVK